MTYHKKMLALVVASAFAAGCSGKQDTAEGAEAAVEESGGEATKAPEKMSMEQMMKMDKTKMPSDVDRTAVVKQEPGKVVYWVLPGKRELGPHFGTADDPKLTAQVPEGAPPPVRKLIEELPILIGVPEQAREVADDGSIWTKMPTPFGDKGVPTSGSFRAEFIDRTTTDMDGPPPMTPDDVKAEIRFKDPAGNDYELKPMLVVKPPAPGYQTHGGVMIDASHHGDTGTGSPLMPKTYTYAAFWAFGNVEINGELADEMKMIHCMTTETVRDKDYKLVHTADLPLDPEQTIAGQPHHTHCVVLPVKMTPEGPKYDPVKTAFELPNGKMQPFIHIMFEKDEIVSGPEWGGPTTAPK